MPRADTIQTNFTAGEVSPQIKGRVDIPRYHNGVQRLENFFVLPQGGVRRRSGTRFVSEVKDSSKKVRLKEFEFSTIQAYVLEFGNLYIRFYKDGGIIEVAGVPVEVVTPYLEAELDDLSFAQSADVLYICHPSYQPRKLSRTSHTAWTLTLLSPQDGPYLPEHTGDTALTVSNVVDRATITSSVSEFVIGDVGDYVEYDLDGEKTIAEIMAYVSGTEVTVKPLENVIASLDREVTGVSLAAPGAYVVSASVFHRGNVGSYIKADVAPNSWHLITAYDGANRDRVTVGAALTVKATTGTLRRSNRTITADIESTDAIFVSTDVDRLIRLNFSSEQVWGTITTYTDTKNVSVELERAMPLKENNSGELRDDGITYQWRLGAWSDTTGWPSAVVFHEERLVFANSTEEPQNTWMSRSANYEVFSPTEEDSLVVDDNGITYTIASGQVNSIQWLESGPVLLFGTIGGEWQVKATNISEPITPTNLVVVPQTKHGSKKLQPVRVGTAVLFIERSGRKIRELLYNFEIDAYVANDVSVVSDHIIRDGGQAIDLAYQRSPNSVVWVVREDGQLAAMTYLRDHQIYAWHRHILGGSFGSGDSVVESAAVIPSTNGTEDSLYVVVKRTIDGDTVRYIEYMEADFFPSDEDDKEDMVFVDSALSYDGAPTDTFTGLDHLEGEEVQILADGSVVAPKTVSGGSITLDDPASKVTVGLGYVSLVKTLPVEGGNPNGTAQGKTKRVDKLTIRLIDSLGFKHGSNESSLTQRSFRASGDSMDSSPPLFTGDVSFSLEQGLQSEAGYFVAQDAPYPLTIVSLMPEFVTNRK